ncbi:MAG: hypothetical protein M1838_002804 [Thelocarpon superellum]|nr:MAG: hypothetical protein M1838_002804 [Thelocarpon superellum]
MTTSDNVDLDLQSDSPTFSWTPPRPSQELNGDASSSHGAPTPDLSASSVSFRAGPLVHPALLPGQSLSVSGIASRAFLLGATLGVSISLTVYFLVQSSPLWRPPFFLATLALFHELEFWTTARYNTQHVSISSFLLTSNGAAYKLAHTAALVECLTRNFLFPQTTWFGPVRPNVTTSLGLILIVVGQTTRSLAMAQAGSNFNHMVQTRRTVDHHLVTHGIYAFLRHPSYFGFFWWGIGTQLVLANPICLVAYAVVLWQFFHRRILKEEELLVVFFGNDYEEYRSRTWTGLPLIP